MDLSARDFELLLCEFCKQDLPSNFKVEHDEKEIGGESGTRRQIDTRIIGKIGISDFLICGEAKNWNIAVGAQTIDEVVGKYFSGEVRANKVILFSKNGYTASAITRAKNLGIELLEPTTLDTPIKSVPHIVGVGYLGALVVTITHVSPQENLKAIDTEEYIIIKGDERISFQQMVCRNVVAQLRGLTRKTITDDLSKFKVRESNVLYELKHKPRYLYNGNFEIEVNVIWDYFTENLNAGLLRHVNSNKTKFVDLQGVPFNIISNVLMSPTKVNYENKQDCISYIKEKNQPCFFQLVFTDPDQNKLNPHDGLMILL